MPVIYTGACRLRLQGNTQAVNHLAITYSLYYRHFLLDNIIYKISKGKSDLKNIFKNIGNKERKQVNL